MKTYNYFNNLNDASSELKNEITANKDTILISVNTTNRYKSVLFTKMLSNKLHLPFDVLFSRNIFAPENKNCIIGVVNESGDIILDNALIDFFEITQNYIYSETNRELEEILGHIHNYKDRSLEQAIANKNVILVDYAILSGFKTLCAIKSLIALGTKEISIAVPIISSDIFNYLDNYVDNIFYLKKEKHFTKKEDYYKSFEKACIEDILIKDKNEFNI